MLLSAHFHETQFLGKGLPCPQGRKRNCRCPFPAFRLTLRRTHPRCRPEPLYHLAFVHDPLKDEVLKYANLSWNTNHTYSSGEKCFIQFCLMNRLTSPTGDIILASEGTLIYFACHLVRMVCHSTIKIYLAAFCNLHIISGYDDPLKGPAPLKKGFTQYPPLSGVPPAPSFMVGWVLGISQWYGPPSALPFFGVASLPTQKCMHQVFLLIC